MPARRGWLIAVLPCLVLAGCGGNDDSIKTYKVATPTDKGKEGGEPKLPDGHPQVGGPAPAENGPPKTRLLGAIIPMTNGASYFVKFQGPIEKIDPLEKEFDTFLNSIHVPGEGGKPISWTAPAGWVAGPPNNNRVITYRKADGSAPDLYISQPFGGTVLMNVNRWRGDLGLEHVTEAALPAETKEIMLGGTKAYRVDVKGWGGKSGMGGGK